MIEELREKENMKKYLMTALWIIILLTPSIGFKSQNQEHQHRDTGLKQYEERQKRYEDQWYWQMQLIYVCQPSNASGAKDDRQTKLRKRP